MATECTCIYMYVLHHSFTRFADLTRKSFRMFRDILYIETIYTFPVAEIAVIKCSKLKSQNGMPHKGNV